MKKSIIKYKINGYWYEIMIEGEIEAIDYQNVEVKTTKYPIEQAEKTDI